MSSYLQDKREEYIATIAISATKSDAISLQGKSLVALDMPSAFTGTEITLESSFDGIPFKDAYNSSGTILTIKVGADRHIHLDPVDFYGAKSIKLVSNATELAERKIILILMGV